MTAAARPPAGRRSVTALTWLCGMATAALGVWALLVPASFARFVDFPPYNKHLLHDAGAFQIGIGISLLLACVWSDAVGVALVGFLTADAIHVANHALDLHLGGHLIDPWLLAGLGIVALIALLLHLRLPARPASRPGEDT